METSETEPTERRINCELERRIELFRMNNEDICFFGAEGDCDEMCYKNIEYCARGGFTKCPKYQEKIERLR